MLNNRKWRSRRSWFRDFYFDR